MRVPIRKGDSQTYIKTDPRMTKEKYQELKSKLERMKKSHPPLAEEVKHLASMGDFSENAGYQLAKGRLRGLNQRISDTENLLTRAEIITNNKNKDRVEMGHKVTVEVNGKTKIYKILGSTETDPIRGIISYQSPLGIALIGKRAGETVAIKLVEKEVTYKIIKID